VYQDVAQWTMIRQTVLDKGHSRWQVARETGLSREYHQENAAEQASAAQQA
jgi:hypothetical protein